MLERFKRWLRGQPDTNGDEREDELKEAMHRHAATNRLVQIHASKSANALRRLNEVLEMRARALENISTAEDALSALDRNNRDDK